MKPAIPEGGPRSLGLFPVLPHEVGALDDQLAHPAGGNLVSSFIHQANADVSQLPTDGTQPVFPAGVMILPGENRVSPRGLSQSVDLNQPGNRFSSGLLQGWLRRHGCTSIDDRVEASQIVALQVGKGQ